MGREEGGRGEWREVGREEGGGERRGRWGEKREVEGSGGRWRGVEGGGGERRGVDGGGVEEGGEWRKKTFLIICKTVNYFNNKIRSSSLVNLAMYPINSLK